MIKLDNLFMKQKMMTKVLISLAPILLFSIWLFGLRTLLLLAVVTVTGILSEYGILRMINGDKTKVSEAVLVSCVLFTLTLPPSTPVWVAMVGIAFGVIFGKCVFGGFGRNIFNPALVGRCLIYVSFPAYMTVSWSKPFAGFPGGLLRYDGGIDAMTAATPMLQLNNTGAATSYLSLFFGNTAGSLGETSALLILAAAVYLIITKTASWRIMVSCLVSFSALNAILYWIGTGKADPLFAVLSGGFLFATVFMATDPVSAPQNETAKVIYGLLIGILAVVIRTFSIFTEGIMFAILIANTFAPLIDRQVRQLAVRTGRKKVEA
ncbi:MAG: RnfABCDGE type electron transport complex subunit D [Saccharofermentanales bacterium]|jgi:Na+-transporting NADH:ubiquinone oxidoreductase subunit B